jgi:hypothetical protein
MLLMPFLSPKRCILFAFFDNKINKKIILALAKNWPLLHNFNGCLGYSLHVL